MAASGADDGPLRAFELNVPLSAPNAKAWGDNAVSTSKYNAVSFVPKTILEFFRIVANVYFLLISCLQAFTTLSPTNKYTTAGPLLIVLIITMIKQGVEDWNRHKADSEMNNRIAHVLTRDAGGAGARAGAGADGVPVVDKTWREVRVGDIIEVRDHEELPADVVLLATSEEEGRCFTETANLDGETNLKRREAVKDTAMRCGWRGVGGGALPRAQVMQQVLRLGGAVRYEEKNNSLYTFVGTMDLQPADGAPAGVKQVPLGPSNVILRGCMLRNSTFALGLVIYTGGDTKLMQNSRPTPSKQSNAYKVVNKCITLIFFTQFVMCVVSAIGFQAWSVAHEGGRVWYMGSLLHEITAGDTFAAFLTFIMLYNNLVPISLYVSLDMIKIAQAQFMERDRSMMYVHEETGEEKWAKVRTSDLNEDLGQIEYIFSDKTGTLTRNIMEFRKCSIAGVAYGFGTTEIGKAAMENARGGQDSPNPSAITGLSAEAIKRMSDPKAAQANYNPKIHFDDPRLLRELASGAGPKAAAIREFLTLLAVCHTVIPEVEDGEVKYRASSPDEEALVKAAKCLGFNFLTPSPSVKVEEKLGPKAAASQRTYQILNINEFNSTRKRMSVVVRTPEGNVVLYCKGADNVMFERSTSVMGSTQPALLAHLRSFASEGLRTLVLSRRDIPADEYARWNEQHKAAAASITKRDELLAAAAEAIERDMQVIGATAIEDKLQEGVPNCIHDLAQAGIKIWVLTGDKVETAINIGYACQLLTQRMTLVHVNKFNLDELAAQLEKLRAHESIAPLVRARNPRASDRLALIVDGSALTALFTPAEPGQPTSQRQQQLSLLLLQIARCCKAVVACRVSPAQKAAIVSLVRRNVSPAPMTLAIGDGANDVNMIQTAQVGIGISGQEGVQAVNSSDYAIAQFKFLKQLLLVHGRINYQRISKVILYSFYKNIALVLTLFCFNFENGFSGTSLYESFIMAGWNFFLAIPIIVIGIWDVDVYSHVAERNPALYISGQDSHDLNVMRFLQWICNAVAHALLVFYLTRPIIGGILGDDGQGDGVYAMGTIVYSSLLMLMQYKVAMECRVWTEWFHIALWCSILSFFLFVLAYTAGASIVEGNYAGVGIVVLGRPAYWFTWIGVSLTAITIDIVVQAGIFAERPSPHQVLRYWERYLTPRDETGVPGRKKAMVEGGMEGGAEAIRGDDIEGVVDQTRHPNTGFAFNTATRESYFAKAGAALRGKSQPWRRQTLELQPNPAFASGAPAGGAGTGR